MFLSFMSAKVDLEEESKLENLNRIKFKNNNYINSKNQTRSKSSMNTLYANLNFFSD